MFTEQALRVEDLIVEELADRIEQFEDLDQPLRLVQRAIARTHERGRLDLRKSRKLLEDSQKAAEAAGADDVAMEPATSSGLP